MRTALVTAYWFLFLVAWLVVIMSNASHTIVQVYFIAGALVGALLTAICLGPIANGRPTHLGHDDHR